MPEKVKHEVNLILPMSENMELVAAQTASCLAELIGFEQTPIDELHRLRAPLPNREGLIEKLLRFQ